MAEHQRPSIFFDTSVVIAGAFSIKGASYILMQLAGLTLIDGRISLEVRLEAERNVTLKMAAALPALHILLREALQKGPSPSEDEFNPVATYAHPKDIVILASAVAQNCQYLVTLNEKDFWPPPTIIKVVRPGELLRVVRRRLTQLEEE